MKLELTNVILKHIFMTHSRILVHEFRNKKIVPVKMNVSSHCDSHNQPFHSDSCSDTHFLYAQRVVLRTVKGEQEVEYGLVLV